MVRRQAGLLRVSAMISRPLRPNAQEVCSSLVGGWFDLCSAVAGLPISLTRISPPTIVGLRDYLSKMTIDPKTRPEIFHFSGSSFPLGLEFEDEMGKVDQIAVTVLSSYLRASVKGSKPIDLCFFRTNASEDIIEGVSAALLRDQVASAVLFDVKDQTDEEAMTFASDLYRNLIDRLPLEQAVAVAGRGTARPHLFGKKSFKIQARRAGSTQIFDSRPAGSLEKRQTFLGRETLLIDLARRFQEVKGLTVVSGILGIGKTALITEALHRSAWRFPGGVTSITLPQSTEVNDNTTFESILSQVSKDLGLIEQPRLGVSETLIEHCSNHPTILFFDNIGRFLSQNLTKQLREEVEDEPDLMLDFIRKASERCHVILAVRNVPISLDNYLRENESSCHYPLTEGLELLAARRLVIERAIRHNISSLVNEQAAAELASATHGHPKLIEIAIGHARRSSVKRVLTDLRKFRGSVVELLKEMINSSIDTLRGVKQQTAFAIVLFPAGSCSYEEMQEAIGVDPTEALMSLEQAGLVAYVDKLQRYSWHASVFECIAQYNTDTNLDDKARDRLLRYYGKHLPGRVTHTKSADPEVTNMLSILEGAKSFSDLQQVVKDVIEELDPILHVLGRWTESKKVVRRVLELCEEAGLTEVRSQLLNRLACSCQALSEFSDAEIHYRSSLMIRPDDAGTLHGLGRLAHDQGKLDLAEDCYKKSLDLAVKLNDDRAKARVQHEFGRLQHQIGEFANARVSFIESISLRRGLVSHKKKVGRWDKWDLAASLHELGSLEQTIGKSSKAIELYEESLDIRKRLDQPDKRGMADTLHALGSIRQSNGETARAEILFNKSLNLKREVFDGRGCAATLSRLAEINILTGGESARSFDLYNEAVSLQTDIDPLNLCSTWNSMARYYYENQDQFDDARRLYQLVIETSDSHNFLLQKSIAQMGVGRLTIRTNDHLVESLAAITQASMFLDLRNLPEGVEAASIKAQIEDLLIENFASWWPKMDPQEASRNISLLSSVLPDEQMTSVEAAVDQIRAGQTPTSGLTPHHKKALLDGIRFVSDVSFKVGRDLAVDIILKLLRGGS